jgi:hypothetical protein
MSVAITTLSLKIPTVIKTKLVKKAKSRKQTISDYLRSIIMEKLEITPNRPNPFMELAGTMTENEADNMLKSIQNNRNSRKESYWQNLLN